MLIKQLCASIQALSHWGSEKYFSDTLSHLALKSRLYLLTEVWNHEYASEVVFFVTVAFKQIISSCVGAWEKQCLDFSLLRKLQSSRYVLWGKA